MAKSKHTSETPATQWLKKNKVPFTEYRYDYVDHGGAAEAAQQLAIDLHSIAKTLIMEDEHAQPLIVLMHGDWDVSTKNLARQVQVKKITPCHPDTAQRHSGYQVGGTSPFATRKKMPVYIQASLLELDTVYLNGGRRGYMIGIAAHLLQPLLTAVPVQAGLAKA